MQGDSQSARGAVTFGLLAPALALMSIVVLCALFVLRMSFGERNAELTSWTLQNYRELFDPYFIRIIVNTLLYAAGSALITVVVAFPVALFLARTSSDFARRSVLICIMLPMLISLLVQSYGWMAILGPDGLVNRMLGAILGTERPVQLLFNGKGVMLGLVQTALPLAVLPMVSSLGQISPQLEEAAGVLGASRWRVYAEIIIPLAWPGVAAGTMLVFGFNAGAFVVPLLLGGLKVTTVALAISDQMGTLLNWPLGSALSVVLIVIAATMQIAYRSLGRSRSNLS
jgi:putative spermidine/putrescine transport system permease protein